MFELFTIIPTSAYRYKESLSAEFKKQLHTVDKSIKVIGPIATDGTYYFSFKFFNRKLYNDYTDTVIKILKIDFTLLKATKDNFERALDQEYNARTCKTIRITNIPYHIDKEIIESCIISQLGEIDFTQEYLTNKQRSNAKYYPTQRPKFRQLFVTFKSETTLEKIFIKDNIWSLFVQEYAARILPVNAESEIFKERTETYYKLTGVPLNCNYYDLEPIIKRKLNAKACIIEGYKQNGCTIAYAYVRRKFYDENKFIA